MLKKLSLGLCAGILISIGGAVYLSCENKIAGAVLFSVALLCICMLGYSLYTGKICYILQSHDKDYISLLLLGLLGNLIATTVCGLLIRYALPSVGESAYNVCSAKLSAQGPLQTVIRGIFCGMLVYLSVEIYKKHNNVVGIIMCIPTFILSGYEHSIADMFYFGASGIVSAEAFVFIWLVIIGNSIGGIILPLLGQGIKGNG